jgi:hypothetical protein
MKTRNVWIAAILLVLVTIGLEVLVYGWENWDVSISALIFRALYYSPVFFPIVLASPVFFGLFGMWIADQKDRSLAAGFFVGFFLGPVGVLIEAALPHSTPKFLNLITAPEPTGRPQGVRRPGQSR